MPVNHSLYLMFNVPLRWEKNPKYLMINWNCTRAHYIPVGSWTMAKEGSKRVVIAAMKDTPQITAEIAGTISGKFLQPHLIYADKHQGCCHLLSS